MHSVGLLYSAQEFISFVQGNRVVGQEFEELRKRFGVAKPSDIYSLSMRCNWVQLDDSGVCVLTVRGRDIFDQADEKEKLKYQLKDIIEVYQPTWAIRIRNGRKEFQESIPGDIFQIFKEAALFDDWTDEIIEWWDDLAQRARMVKNAELLETGRRAEKLSMTYEETRTGKAPHWRSLESNFSGYDILSVRGPHSSEKIKIEVKGSELGLNDSHFYVTQNEWTTAIRSETYKFHLWILKGVLRLIELDASDVAAHIPQDTGEGKWQSVRIPFKTFSSKAVEVR